MKVLETITFLLMSPWPRFVGPPCTCKTIWTKHNNHANTSLLNFYRPGTLPDAIPTLSEHWRHIYSYLSILLLKAQWCVYIRLTWQQWRHRVAVASERISLYPAPLKLRPNTIRRYTNLFIIIIIAQTDSCRGTVSTTTKLRLRFSGVVRSPWLRPAVSYAQRYTVTCVTAVDVLIL